VTQLRIGSYNIHSMRDDRDALVEVVRALDLDVLIVQEGPRRLRWRTRAANLAHDCDLVYATGGLPSLGNVIMTSYRIRVLDTWALRYPLTPGRHMRGAAFARCVLDRTGFVLVGTHLATDPTERPGQAEQLRKALADLQAPVLLGADLNEDRNGPAHRLLVDGLVDAAGGDSSPTYPVAAPASRIDALLVDPGLEVRDYRVVDTPAARRASDHFPVVAELTLPG
jgi:endonuclease/exonuclease/phosphatase family metal-dependent hydrolase